MAGEAAQVPEQTAGETVDYDIQGVVGIRLLNARPRAVRAVTGQIGPPGGSLDRDPDIEIRFVDTIPTPGLRFLGLDDAGFDDDGFYLLRSSKAACKLRIPFEDIGLRQLRITAEHELKSVPLLIALINLTFLSRNYLPLHSSAFSLEGRVSLVTGWAKGGKTEAMLAFAEIGAAYISDEWTLLDGRGDSAFGIAEPIRLWDWQLRQVPRLRQQIGLGKRATFGCINALDAIDRFLARSPVRKLPPARLLHEALPPLKRQLNVRLQPGVIFQDRIRDSGRVDSVFLIMSHDSPEIVVQDATIDEIAERMISSNQYELLPFLEKYHAFRFAFPELANAFIESSGTEQRRLLHATLAGKQAYRVLHPYPVNFEALAAAMQPYCVPGNPTVEAVSAR